MSIIQRALSEMSFRINRRLLELTFIDPMTRYRQSPGSVEKQIMDLVLRPRVLYDLNVVGGVEVLVNLSSVPREEYNQYESVYRIPKELTNGRPILSVLSISYLSPTIGYQYRQSALCGRSGLLQGADALLRSQADIPIFSSHLASLIGENVVLIKGASSLPMESELRCIVGYDENLSNFSIRSTQQFVKLVELAVKSYIFNKMEVDLDQGYLSGGVALDSIKSIVDRYADAEELYQEHLKDVMSKVTFMQDQESMSRYTRLIIGAGYR